MLTFPSNSSTFLLLSFALCCLSSKITRLYSETLEENVFLDNDPWIIGVENRVKFGALERIYEKVKDRVNVGVIGEKDLSLYFRDQEMKEKSSSLGALIIYPFGPKIHKMMNGVSAHSEEAAIEKAFDSFPDITNKLPNTIDNKNTMLRDFIQQAYSTVPTKFPVLLFTDETKVPLFFKLLSLKFSLLFHFGIIENAPLATLAVFSIFNVPKMVVLLTEIQSDGTPRIKPILYDEGVHGQLAYSTAMRFLYLVHKKFFAELLKEVRKSVADDFNIDEIFESHFAHFPELLQLPPGTKSNNHKTERKKVKDALEHPNCHGIDVCMILVDKDLQNESQLLNNVVVNLTLIKDKIVQQDKSAEIIKMDLNCNEELEIAFDIYVMDLPVLLLLRPKRQIYTLAVVKELPTSINEFIEKTLAGKVAHYRYKTLPNLNVCNYSEDMKTITYDLVKSPNEKSKGRSEL